MSSQETFGLNLRRARQHRGVSLDDIASQTNVAVDLWEDMERNDFTRWPSGIYARTWVRAYAELIGLDPNETVNDFCRWFPQGDRRAERLVRGQAQIVGHALAWHDDLLPVDGDRRASAMTASDRLKIAQARHVRLIAAASDLAAVAILSKVASGSLSVSVWPTFGIMAAFYHATSLALLGCTPAVWAVDTYVSAHPRSRRRGERFAFRRLGPARKDDLPLGRGAAS